MPLPSAPDSRRAPRSKRVPPVRRGHALLELLVAALLLTVGASATLSLLHATLSAAALSVQLSAARDVAREQSETLVRAPCAASSGSSTREGLTGDWTTVNVGPSVEQSVSLSPTPSPLSAGAPPALTTTLRGWCS